MSWAFHAVGALWLATAECLAFGKRRRLLGLPRLSVRF
jgi:hypothetical protein